MRQNKFTFFIAVLSVILPLAARSQVTFSWNAASGPTITNYTLFWGTNSGLYIYSLDAGPQTSVSVTGLAPGGVFYFSVQATASDGTDSPFSNEICYTNPAPVVPPGPTNSSVVTSSSSNTNGQTSNNSSNSSSGPSSNANNGTPSLTLNGSVAEYPVPGVPPAMTLALSNQTPLMNVFGTVGASMSVESSTNLGSASVWTPVADVSITNAAAVASNSSVPSTINLAFVPGAQSVQLPATNPAPNQFFRVVMPYDYMVLADSVLWSQGSPARLVLVVMPGTPSDDVCYVTPQSSFLFYDQTNQAFAMEPSGSTIRQIATTLSGSLGQNWTSASEFAYSNGVSTILATVVKTQPASSDPVAGTAAPSISIDF